MCILLIFPLNVWLYGFAEPSFNHFYVNMLFKYSAQTWICINPIITVKHFQLNMHEHLLCSSATGSSAPSCQRSWWPIREQRQSLPHIIFNSCHFGYLKLDPAFWLVIAGLQKVLQPTFTFSGFSLVSSSFSQGVLKLRLLRHGCALYG